MDGGATPAVAMQGSAVSGGAMHGGAMPAVAMHGGAACKKGQLWQCGPSAATPIATSSVQRCMHAQPALQRATMHACTAGPAACNDACMHSCRCTVCMQPCRSVQAERAAVHANACVCKVRAPMQAVQHGGALQEMQLWGLHCYGVNSAMGSALLWGQLCYGVSIAMGSALLWGELCYGVSSYMGSTHLWGQPCYGVSTAMG